MNRISKARIVGGERLTLTEYGAAGLGLHRAAVLIALSITDRGFMDSISPRPSRAGWIWALDPSTGRIWPLDLEADVAAVYSGRLQAPPAASLTSDQARELVGWMAWHYFNLPGGVRTAYHAMRAQLEAIGRVRA